MYVKSKFYWNSNKITTRFFYKDAVITDSSELIILILSSTYQIISSFEASFKVDNYRYLLTVGLEILPAMCKQLNEEILMHVNKSLAQI